MGTKQLRHLPTEPVPDASVFELVDALVEVVDIGRDLDRLRAALDDVLGVRAWFDAELRFNGLASSGLCLICEDIVGEDFTAVGVASS